MTTRAHIIIDGIKLYHHADGYPSHMVCYLLRQMQVERFMAIDAEEMATCMVRYGGFSCAQGEHGDEEFLYRVNTKRKDVFVYGKENRTWKFIKREKA